MQLGPLAGRRFALAGALMAAACVNNYVLEEGVGTDTGTSSGASASGSGVATATASAAGSGSTDAGSGSGSTATEATDSGTAGVTLTGTGSGSTTGSGGGELCQKCSADAQCGGAADLCVQLGEALIVCLRQCGEGCPAGFSCGDFVSVDGANAQQCAPDTEACFE